MVDSFCICSVKTQFGTFIGFTLLKTRTVDTRAYVLCTATRFFCAQLRRLSLFPLAIAQPLFFRVMLGQVSFFLLQTEFLFFSHLCDFFSEFLLVFVFLIAWWLVVGRISSLPSPKIPWFFWGVMGLAKQAGYQ